jgi:hypothetical protein
VGTFSTPRSNKRRAGLPSSHSIGCRATALLHLDLPPFRLCCAPAPRWIHTLLTSLPFWSCQTPALCQIHAPQGSLPLKPLPLRPCRTPVLHGTTGAMPRQDPHSLGPAKIHPAEITALWGWATSRGETATSPSPLGSLSLGLSQAPALQAFQITAPPGSHAGHH